MSFQTDATYVFLLWNTIVDFFEKCLFFLSIFRTKRESSFVFHRRQKFKQVRNGRVNEDRTVNYPFNLYMQSHSNKSTLPPTNRVYFLFSVWLIAWCCEPGAGGGALGPCSYLLTVFEKWASPWDSVSIKLLQLQRERDSRTLSSSFPSNCLHWVPASWQLAIGWTRSSWWLGMNTCRRMDGSWLFPCMMHVFL